MDVIRFLIDFILHIDVHLAELVAQYGVWVYAILFLILFCETGLVVTPFLPGDSLLFVAGALSALPTNDLNVHLMVVLMVIAAILTLWSMVYYLQMAGAQLRGEKKLQ